MTVTPDGSPGVSGPVAAHRSTPLERPRFPLVWKLFLLTTLLIVMVVGVAIGVTIERANRIARKTVNTSIVSASRLFEDFESQRLGRLVISAQLVGSDPYFSAYIQDALSGAAPEAKPGSPPRAAESPAGIDYVSIVDQLSQRRESFGSDLVMLLDDQGRLLARSDQPALTAARGEDLYNETPLVRRAVDDAALDRSTGVLFTSGRLYHAAVVPVAAGANHVRVGYLVNAYAIDDAFANRIAESTNAGVMFVASPAVGGSGSLSRSANAPSVGMGQMHGIGEVFRSGRNLSPSNIDVDGSSYVITGRPLTAESQIVGAAVFVRSLDRELQPFREIEQALFIGGGIALLLAFAFSWFVAKRVTRPIEDLARIAQAVTAGDYDVHPAIDRSDEVGILGRAFAKMITTLRDKAELEDLYEEMASRSQTRPPLQLDREPVKAGADSSVLPTMKLGTAIQTPRQFPAPTDLLDGQMFAGRYRIEQVLGRGGMGVVYRATDTQLDETVAIKTLPGDVMQRSPDQLERFKREIRLARKITHRNVLRTYDYGEADGVYFISMEFVRGYTLSDLLGQSDQHQLTPRVAVGVARQICRGLEAAHEQGIIHRDIKPQNVMIDHKGEVKLMDFGIARTAEAPESMTQVGLIVGTPHYMSPEQAQGKALDPRSDVYSMGVLAYEMLAGRRPFEASSLVGVLTAHITEKPRPVSEFRSDLGRELNAIVMRCLAKEPLQRYRDAGELLGDLDALQMQQASAA